MTDKRFGFCYYIRYFFLCELMVIAGQVWVLFSGGAGELVIWAWVEFLLGEQNKLMVILNCFWKSMLVDSIKADSNPHYNETVCMVF